MHLVAPILQMQNRFFHRATRLGASLALMLLTTYASSADWTYPRSNPEMTGLANAYPNFPLELAWSVELGNKSRKEGIVATAITHQGKVYLGSQSGKFACINLSDGKVIWEKKVEGQIEGNAALFEELVIFGSSDGNVYALNQTDGKEVWKFETEGEVHAGATLAQSAKHGQILLIGSYDNCLYALDKQGKKLWSYETTNYINGAVATSENQVVFGGCDGILYLLDLDTGKEVKTVEVGAYIGNNVAIQNRLAYLGHYGNRVAAYDLEKGIKLWEFGEREFPFYAAPALTADRVYAGGRDKRMHALDLKTGEEAWQFRTRGDIDSSPVLLGPERLLFGSNDGHLYLLNTQDGAEVWKYLIGAPVKSSPAVTETHILVGSDDGFLYAFRQDAKASSALEAKP